MMMMKMMMMVKSKRKREKTRKLSYIYIYIYKIALHLQLLKNRYQLFQNPKMVLKHLAMGADVEFAPKISFFCNEILRAWKHLLSSISLF